MKTIEFKKAFKTGIKVPELTLPIDTVINWSGSLEDLKSQAGKLQESLKDDKFDWKRILINHIKSRKWAEGHPLIDGESIQLAMDVHKCLNGSAKVKADNKVVDYICDVAASVEWTTGLHEDVLPYAAEFKKYFKELKESKGEGVDEVA